MNTYVLPKTVQECVGEILGQSALKQRKFVETVKLHITLCDPRRDEGFSGRIKLEHAPKLRFRLCILGDQQHCEEARANGLACRNKEFILALSTRKRRLERLTKKYDAFLASPSVYEEIPDDLLNALSASYKDPIRLTHEESMMAKVDEVKTLVFLKPRTRSVVVVTVGNVGMPRDKLAENICTAIEKLDDRLKGNWTNILNLHLKTCRGDPHLIY